MVTIILFCFIISQFSVASILSQSSPCGDWVSLNDETCFKVMRQKVVSFDIATEYCASLDAHLPTIRSQAEQSFLETLFFNKLADSNNIWLGGRYLNGQYIWTVDNSTIDGFSNWERVPKNVSDHCVKMDADEDRRGKWIDEPCTKLNLLVCQKDAIWSSALIQATLLKTMKQLEQANRQIAQLQANPQVPIGFIYVQLPNSTAPSDLWPGTAWTEISSTFAGTFFRVTGGKAATFGERQEETSPYLKQVDYLNDCPEVRSTTLRKGFRSNSVISGIFANGGFKNCLSFLTTNDEVRPSNMAVKVWKRSA